jgi:HEAT repeat protein
MLWRHRPNVHKAARSGDAKRLERALHYHDLLSDSQGRVYDLGVGVRRDAALALTSVADTDAVDVGNALIGALGDPSGEVRQAAAAALGARREGRAAAALAEGALTWRDPRYEAARLAAADALSDMSGPESAQELLRLVIDRPADETRARGLVTRMVARGGGETARTVCVAAAAELSADDGARIERAAEVLSWLGPIAVEPLLAALDGSRTARIPLIEALARLGDLRAGNALVRLLSDGDAGVRAAAAAALGQIADPAGAQALVAASHDPDQYVRAAALDAIRRLGPLVVPAEDESGWRGARAPARFRSSSG